jgi:amino acid transporter
MPKANLKRELGVIDSVMLIAGTTIGIGIFVTTGLVAQHIPSPGGILLVWLLGGLLALAGALSCAELGASLPSAAGGLANISPHTHTPANAIILQSLWASILILSGTFDALLIYVTVMIVLFSALTVGALLVLRTKRPDLQRPYEIWGYPIVPCFFIIAHSGITAAIF